MLASYFEQDMASHEAWRWGEDKNLLAKLDSKLNLNADDGYANVS